jgi:hypothetical protein
MRLFNFILAITAVFVFTPGFQCGECTTIDCDPGYVAVQFLSKTDDSDLFADSTYQRDSLQLFTLAGDGTAADYSYQLNGWKISNLPAPYFTIDKDAVGYIFQYNSLERDTLGLTFTWSEDSDCCPAAPVVTYGIFRGDTIFPDAGAYLILKK